MVRFQKTYRILVRQSALVAQRKSIRLLPGRLQVRLLAGVLIQGLAVIQSKWAHGIGSDRSFQRSIPFHPFHSETIYRCVADPGSNCLLSSDMLVRIQPHRLLAVLSLNVLTNMVRTAPQGVVIGSTPIIPAHWGCSSVKTYFRLVRHFALVAQRMSIRLRTGRLQVQFLAGVLAFLLTTRTRGRWL